MRSKRKQNGKLSALTGSAYDPNASAAKIQYPLYERESQAVALLSARGVSLIKLFKNMAHDLLAHAVSRVADGYGKPVRNAETFIIGCLAGALGIGVSWLALFPINSLIERLSGLEDLTAQLPLLSAILLVLLSIIITMIGGLLPAKKAANKDPVVALRTE